jgi:hypothetical protein
MNTFRTTWRGRPSRLPLVVAVAAAVVVVAAAGGVTAWVLAGHDDPPPTTGQCRLLSVPEVARATGLKAVKPIPIGTEPDLICSYFYDLSATIPSLEDFNNGKTVPAGVYVGFFATAVGIDGVDRDLASGNLADVPALGATAGWSDRLGELVLKLPHGAMRISVDKPDAGRHLRTSDRKAIAIDLYRAAASRLP